MCQLTVLLMWSHLPPMPTNLMTHNHSHICLRHRTSSPPISKFCPWRMLRIRCPLPCYGSDFRVVQPWTKSTKDVLLERLRNQTNIYQIMFGLSLLCCVMSIQTLLIWQLIASIYGYNQTSIVTSIYVYVIFICTSNY